MAKAIRKNKAQDPLADLPPWAQKLAERYYTKTVSTFLLYGAVRDLQPITARRRRRAATARCKTFLSDELFGGRDHVLFYDRSSRHPRAPPRRRSRTSSGRWPATTRCTAPTSPRSMPRDPGRALQMLENYLRVRLADGKSLALIIDFAETLAPGGELAHLSAEDRFVLVTLVEVGARPAVPLGRPLDRADRREPRRALAADRAQPLRREHRDRRCPNEEERLDFVKYKLEGRKLADASPTCRSRALAKMTAGLSRINLDRLLTEAIERGHPDHPRAASRRRRRRSSRPSATGCSSSSSRRYTLDVVAGHAKAKEMLRDAASALQEGAHRGDADGLPDLAARWAPARPSWSPASPATSASPA